MSVPPHSSRAHSSRAHSSTKNNILLQTDEEHLTYDPSKNETILEGLYMTRQLSMTSVRRHLAGWKRRYLIFTPKTGVLEVCSADRGTRTCIKCLDRQANVTFGRHFYPPEDNDGSEKVETTTKLAKNGNRNSSLVWLRYWDGETASSGSWCELVIDFMYENQANKWVSMLEMTQQAHEDWAEAYSPWLSQAFRDLLNEQWESQAHASSDLNSSSLDSPQSAGYYQRPDFLHQSLEMSGLDALDTRTIDFETEVTQISELEIVESDDDSVLEGSVLEQTEQYPNDGQLRKMSLTPKGSKPFPNTFSRAHDLHLPPISILIMAVGTRGDIQPFIQLGLRLRADGHRIRLATHATFRQFVKQSGLEFYPLAGDPVLLSSFMVKTQGCVLPTSADVLLETPKYQAMLVEILESTWAACTERDPEEDDKLDFRPDAIISNPVTYGHIHCAEALGVPLHLMFPQPWTPTKAFPHPLSFMSYARTWRTENFISYGVIDRALWISLEWDINRFRVSTLGLEPLRAGQGAWNLANYHRVPFVKMWSPSLVPKPKDWPSHVDIVGTFFDQPSEGKSVDSNFSEVLPELNRDESADSLPPLYCDEYTPSSELASFLASGSNKTSTKDGKKPIIFVGFGSMVIAPVELERILLLFLETAAMMNVKLLFQLGWTAMSNERFKELALIAQDKARFVRNATRDQKLVDKLSDDESFCEMTNTINTDSSASGDYLMLTRDLPPIPHDNEPKRRGSIQGLFNSVRGLVGLGPTPVSTFPIPSTTSSRVSKSLEYLDDWEAMEEELEASHSWDAAKDCHLAGPCPHGWLFRHVAAVVHHGGAGTTAIGLRMSRPTWICPFFGDQFFWGHAIERRGLGPVPIPVSDITFQIALDCFSTLLSPETAQCVREIAHAMANENGVESAVKAFYHHLPTANMICEVSVMRGKTCLAHVFCQDCQLRMSYDVCMELHQSLKVPCIYEGGSPELSSGNTNIEGVHRVVPICYRRWTNPAPTNAAQGLLFGLGGLVHEMAEGVADAVSDPLKGIYHDGVSGGVAGLYSGLQRLAKHQLTGGTVFYERLREGMAMSLAAVAEKANAARRQRSNSADISSTRQSFSTSDRSIDITLLDPRASKLPFVQFVSKKNAQLRLQRVHVSSKYRPQSASTQPTIKESLRPVASEISPLSNDGKTPFESPIRYIKQGADIQGDSKVDSDVESVIEGNYSHPTFLAHTVIGASETGTNSIDLFDSPRGMQPLVSATRNAQRLLVIFSNFGASGHHLDEKMASQMLHWAIERRAAIPIEGPTDFLPSCHDSDVEMNSFHTASDAQKKTILAVFLRSLAHGSEFVDFVHLAQFFVRHLPERAFASQLEHHSFSSAN